MFVLNQRKMSTASFESRIAGKRTVLNTESEQMLVGSMTKVDSRQDVAFSRVLEALQKTFQFVTGTIATDNNSKKRKITEDDNRHSSAKKRRTDFEECVNTSDNDRDNDCSICLAPWSACGDHRLTSLKCGHLFGHSCIVRWIESAHNCPYCCSHAEIADLRNIFAQKVHVPVEDTTDRDLAIELLRKERAVRKELKRKLDRQKADNESLRLELYHMKAGRNAGRTGYFSDGFGIVAALTAVKDSLSKRLSRVFTRRCRIKQSQFSMSEHRNQCELTPVDVSLRDFRRTE